MARPRRTEEPADQQIVVRLTEHEMMELDRKRLPKESRSAAVRRLLGLVGPEPEPPAAPSFWERLGALGELRRAMDEMERKLSQMEAQARDGPPPDSKPKP